MNKNKVAISDYLSHGRENAVFLRDLEGITGLPGRDIRKRIEIERREGFPILSDVHAGYYLPGNDAETKRFLKSMRHRAREILKTAQAVELSQTGKEC